MHLLHSQESVDRAILTLRDITQELNGRGISAVMLLEEQVALQRDMIQELQQILIQIGIQASWAETRLKQQGA